MSRPFDFSPSLICSSRFHLSLCVHVCCRLIALCAYHLRPALLLTLRPHCFSGPGAAFGSRKECKPIKPELGYRESTNGIKNASLAHSFAGIQPGNVIYVCFGRNLDSQTADFISNENDVKLFIRPSGAKSEAKKKSTANTFPKHNDLWQRFYVARARIHCFGVRRCQRSRFCATNMIRLRLGATFESLY